MTAGRMIGDTGLVTVLWSSRHLRSGMSSRAFGAIGGYFSSTTRVTRSPWTMRSTTSMPRVTWAKIV